MACSPPRSIRYALACCASTPSLFGRTDAYTIYDQADLRRVIEALLIDHGRQAIQGAIARCGQPSAAELERELALAKSRLLDPQRYVTSSRYAAAPVVAAVWDAVEEELERCNAFAFDDLLVFAVRLLREHPHRLAHLRARWRWVVVDEMQDTNEAQAALVHLLAGSDGNVTVVGDDDQAIYRFRSAEPRNILAFGERYPDHAAGRPGPQLPLARRDPARRRDVHRRERSAPPQGAARDARRRRSSHDARLRARPRRGGLGGVG